MAQSGCSWWKLDAGEVVLRHRRAIVVVFGETNVGVVSQRPSFV